MSEETPIYELPAEVPISRTFSDITTSELNGSGLFDELMRTAKEHLQEEYASQRIKSVDYSKVYLGSMEAALANTVQYLLGMSLVDAQKRKLDVETEAERQRLALIPLQVEKLEAEIKQIGHQSDLLVAQIAKTEQDTANAVLQGELIKQQTIKVQREITYIETQDRGLTYQIDNMYPQELANLTLTGTKLDEEIQLITANTAKTVNESDLVSEKIRELTYQIDNLYPENLKKIQGEVALINAKTDSEKKQPELIATQQNLLNTQIEGFNRDAEQKAAKLMADVWAVQVSVDEGRPVPRSLINEQIDLAVNHMLTGIGINL